MANKIEQNVANLYDRLMEVSNSGKIDDLARFLGVNNSTLRTRKARGSVPYEEIVSKCSAEEIAYIFKNEHLSSAPAHNEAKDDDIDFSAQTSEFAEIPFYSDVRVSAGTGLIPREDKPPLTLQLRKYYINTTLQTSASSLFGIIISGDSMSPKIQPGDMVIIDQSRTQLTEGRVYAVRVDDELYIKQVSPRPGGRLLLISINQEYPPFEVSLDDPNFATIGTAVNLSRTLI